MKIPRLGQGTWAMEKDDRREAIRAIRRGLDLGLTHIDTAEMYGTEELVGEAIRGRRDEVFLATKALPSSDPIAACEKSLKRLKTDRLDLYLLHWRQGPPDYEAFQALQRQGKILAWGVSNFDVADLEEAPPVACNQVLYHLRERAVEHAVIPWCERRGVTVVGYSPFGSTRRFPASRALDEVARRHGATPRQVALAFLLRNACLIPKASKVEHVEENAGALKVKLSGRDVALIDREFPIGPPKPLPMI